MNNSPICLMKIHKKANRNDMPLTTLFTQQINRAVDSWRGFVEAETSYLNTSLSVLLIIMQTLISKE